MIRRTDPRVRRRPRFQPTIQGLETRLVLSGVAVAAAPHLATPATAATASAPVPSFPFRIIKFTALFQGTYTQGPARSPGFAIQTHLAAGGNTSAFYHANIQVAFYQPADPSQPAVGQANITPKGQSGGGNVLLLDITAVPGRVDRGGRPNLFTWTVTTSGGGQFTNAEGSGAFQVFYFPSRNPPRGAPAGGRMGVAIRGDLGLNGVSSTVF